MRRNSLFAVGIFLSVIMTMLCIWQAKTLKRGPAKEAEPKKDQTPARNLLSHQSSHASGKNDAHAVRSSSLQNLLHKKLTSKFQCDMKTKEYDDETELIENLAGINDPHRTGYVLVLKLHEQQTKAAENLFSLQCWAKTLFVSIVEPFLINSYLGIPLDETWHNLPKFRDIFDIRVWNLLSAKHKFAPLASWDNFLAKAPRHLIIARFKYFTSSEYKRRRNSLEKITHFAMNSEYKNGCTKQLSEKINYLTTRHNFTVIREVCFNFAEGDELTLLQFNRHLYEGIGPKTVSVLIEEWRGLSSFENGKHVTLFDACWMPTAVKPIAYKWPSRQLICEAKKYKQRFLKADNYITLMVRTEKIESLILTGNLESMNNCLNQTLKLWRTLKTSKGIESTFLSMDIGRYGSYSLMEKKSDAKYHPYAHLYEDFIKKLFGPYATIRTWELGFEKVASSWDSGYIGSLQKTIAAESNCIVFIGGGSFQKHTKYIHESIKKGRKCTKVIHECSRGI